MKAALLSKEYHYEIKDVDEPQVRPGWVKIQVKKTGVCGSEVHAFQGTHPFRKPPIISGHELGGIVVEIGEGVTRFKVGDRVTVEPQYSCGNCVYCRKGSYNLCTSKVVMGTTDDPKKWTGSFAEFVIAPADKTFLIPPHLSFSHGTLIEPLAVGIHSLYRARMTAGKSLLIFGAGTIGLATLINARALGIKDIMITDVKDFNLQTAKDLGATYTVNIAAENLESAVTQAFGEQGVDAAILAVGKASIFKDALTLTKRDGAIVIVGLVHEDITFNLHDIGATGKEKIVTGSTVYTGEDFEKVLKLLEGEEMKKDLDTLITHEMTIDQVQEAHELIVNGKEDVIKIVLEY
jgi:L-iditol 2-dehydrogenase